MARSNSNPARRASRRGSDGDPAQELAAELSYSEAQTALELALAQLQSPDLAVEELTAVYQRAQAYAERCQQVLQEVERTIELWDPLEPETPPMPYIEAP